MLYLLTLVTSAYNSMRRGLSRSGQTGAGNLCWPTRTGLSRPDFEEIREIEG
jgi:hypothetical protein